MNQIFSFKRYGWLLKRQWYENATIYKWGIVLLIIAIVGFFWGSSDWKAVDEPHLGQMETFSIVGVFFLYIYGANFFDSLSSKNKGMFYFSLPVSAFERVAVAFTFVMILLPVLLLIIFSAFDFIFVQLFNHIHGVSVQMFFKTASPLGSIGLLPSMVWAYLSYTSFFVLGSLMFGKKGITITFIVTAVFVFIFFWLRFFIYGQMSIIDFFRSSFFVLLIPVCWVMLFFAMKRKEV